MNVNELLRRIKSRLGLGLYLKTRRSDEQIIKEIIIGITLPTFSRYFRGNIHLKNVKLIKQPGMGNVYSIPLPDHLMHAMEQSGVILKSISNIDYNMFQGGIGPAGSMYAMRGLSYNRRGGVNIDDMVSSYESHLMMTTLDGGLACELIEPYSISFFDKDIEYGSYPLNIEIQTTHANNFSTIKDKIAGAFEELAILDIMSVLYNSEFKHISGTETQYSKVDTKTDNWETADERREALLETFANERISSSPIVIAI